MNAAQLAYHYLGPNSNRVVVELTEACGISTVQFLLPQRELRDILCHLHRGNDEPFGGCANLRRQAIAWKNDMSVMHDMNKVATFATFNTCTQRNTTWRRAARIYAWLTCALLGAGCDLGCKIERTKFNHSLGDLSSADRIEVTIEGLTPVATITDQQRVAAVAAFVGRYRDGWISVWGAAGAARYLTFYRGPQLLRQFGFNARGISDGGYARPLSPSEIAELVGILSIAWPPPENPTGTPRQSREQ